VTGLSTLRPLGVPQKFVFDFSESDGISVDGSSDGGQYM
jgi:hypothetical protein